MLALRIGGPYTEMPGILVGPCHLSCGEGGG